MSDVKNKENSRIKHNSKIKKHNSKIKELKMTSKGRHIIKPKKLLTTSSDEQRKIKNRIIKRKSIDMCDELYELQSRASKPNILRDITFSNKMHTSNKGDTPKISHNASHVLSRSVSIDTSLSHNNHYAKESMKYGSTDVLSRKLIEDLNVSCNDQNLTRSSEHNTKIITRQDSSMSSTDQNLNQSVQHNTNHSISKFVIPQHLNTSFNDQNVKQSIEHDTSHSLPIVTGQDSNMSSNDQNLNETVKSNISHSLSNNRTGQDSSTSCNTRNTDKLLNHNNKTKEPTESINGLEEYNTSQCVVIKLLRYTYNINFSYFSLFYKY